jgi:hypothetical protein
MMGAVKVVTHDGQPRARRRAIYRRLLPAPLKIAETGVTAGLLMIAKDFIPEMGAKSFAIMKGTYKCEVNGAPATGVTLYAAPG